MGTAPVLWPEAGIPAGEAGTCAITPRSCCEATGAALCVAYHAINRLITKNVIASHLVLLDRKLDAPREPNTVADAPPPKPEPACAPAPRCIRINATIPIASST